MSLRTHLLIALATASLAALLIVDVATFVLLGRSQLRQVDDSLARSQQPIEELLGQGTAEALSGISEIAPGTFVALLDPSGSATVIAPVGRRSDDALALDDTTLESLGRQDLDRNDRDARALTVDAVDGDRIRLRIDGLASGRTLITGQSLHELDEIRGGLLRILGLATLAAMATATLLGAYLIRRGLAPLRLVEASARVISDDELAAHRVPGDAESTEVGQLAGALNAMLDRLQAARDEREITLSELRESEARMRRFVADASHELRTPVAATAAYAELFERGARDRPADLDRAMTGIHRETDRMASLIDSLLALTRLDDNQPAAYEVVDLTEVLLEAVEAARAINQQQTIEVSVLDVISVVGDRVGLRQVVDNLLANVRAHTPGGTPCRVELWSENDEALLSVSDEGPGVADADLGRLFERFFRVDQARARATGGAGLGLSIVRAIVEAQGGVITASRNKPSGLSITVRLPNTALPEPGSVENLTREART